MILFLELKVANEKESNHKRPIPNQLTPLSLWRRQTNIKQQQQQQQINLSHNHNINGRIYIVDHKCIYIYIEWNIKFVLLF